MKNEIQIGMKLWFCLILIVFHPLLRQKTGGYWNNAGLSTIGRDVFEKINMFSTISLHLLTLVPFTHSPFCYRENFHLFIFVCLSQRRRRWWWKCLIGHTQSKCEIDLWTLNLHTHFFPFPILLRLT